MASAGTAPERSARFLACRNADRRQCARTGGRGVLGLCVCGTCGAACACMHACVQQRGTQHASCVGVRIAAHACRTGHVFGGLATGTGTLVQAHAAGLLLGTQLSCRLSLQIVAMHARTRVRAARLAPRRPLPPLRRNTPPPHLHVVRDLLEAGGDALALHRSNARTHARKPAHTGFVHGGACLYVSVSSVGTAHTHTHALQSRYAARDQRGRAASMRAASDRPPPFCPSLAPACPCSSTHEPASRAKQC